ncbi:uncharacterized protein BDR25DRAFT_370147 [Lindgomyces ingoldianus]|uniref:Uncharacterized protein n=1 Tax=Lindgomyces ingoldianus TaxID=673940 RepID=A0ACB6QSZ3_9PLEO|nr:uncharacterized protein BDR25DRAFT_370147 [Lindgomyces ingoldianus]KAF2470133.1 hypothetical protein BDR25DRAFT_370147 [Lindgomyces ingoldianus]
MADLEARFVKRGLWTNIEQGPLMGKTITTDIKTGTIVVALLAVLSSAAITNLWHLFAFLAHQLRADGRAADGLQRQQQALLRTLPMPSSLVVDSIKLWWMWRRRTTRVLARSLIYVLLGGLFSVGMVVVGVFSSFVVTTSNIPVLVSSPFCGPLDVDPSGENLIASLVGLRSFYTSVRGVTKPYVDGCYQNTTTELPARCRQVFIRPNIPLSQERVKCPFSSDICLDLGGDMTAVQLDSGLVDLNEAFGMNMASADRVQFRKRTTCSVLKTDGRTSLVNASGIPPPLFPYLPNEQLLLLHYGNRRTGQRLVNASFSHSLLAANTTKNYGTGYVAAFTAPELGDVSDINPLAEMRNSDADLVIIAIHMNRVYYSNPVNDPVFAAHSPYAFTDGVTRKNTTFYFSDFSSGVVGCTEQVYYPGASPIQLAALRLLVSTNLVYGIFAGLDSGLKSSALSADGFVVSLPDDQWINEVISLEQYVWGSLQTVISGYAVGPQVRDESAEEFVRKNMTNGERGLCGLQRMRKSGGFVNINVFGLAFIITFSLAISMLDFFLLKLLIVLTRFRRIMAPRLDRWIQDGVLQLQRRAYEASGEGTWIKLEDEVPLTVGNRQLRELPLQSIRATTTYLKF